MCALTPARRRLCLPIVLRSAALSTAQARLADVIRRGGSTRVRKVAETPFNMVLEARPWKRRGGCGLVVRSRAPIPQLSRTYPRTPLAARVRCGWRGDWVRGGPYSRGYNPYLKFTGRGICPLRRTAATWSAGERPECWLRRLSG